MDVSPIGLTGVQCLLFWFRVSLFHRRDSVCRSFVVPVLNLRVRPTFQGQELVLYGDREIDVKFWSINRVLYKSSVRGGVDRELGTF